MRKPKEARTHKRTVEARNTDGQSQHVCYWHERTRRQESAKERQAYWNSLTIDEQLKVLKTRPGESKRQTMRLESLKAKGMIYSTDVLKHGNVQQHVGREQARDSKKAPPKSDKKAYAAWKRKSSETKEDSSIES